MDPKMWCPWEGHLDHETPLSATARTQFLIFNRYWFSSELELVILALFHQAISPNYTKKFLIKPAIENRHQCNAMHTIKKNYKFNEKILQHSLLPQFLINCWLICMNSYDVICMFCTIRPSESNVLGVDLHACSAMHGQNSLHGLLTG